ncbi:MAG: nitroreductase [Rhodobacteraceae bacterium]|nr:nitroreductase [Paracoccaceae bacterium]
MPEINQPVLDFLLSRRSRPGKTLGLPVPKRGELEVMLTAAARSPDHGKLEPWRFIVLERGALKRLGTLAKTRASALGLPEDKAAKGVSQFSDAHLAVIVVSAPMASDKVPEVEQVLSAGAVCLGFLNAALASGWGANWLTGWAVHDREFLSQGLELADHETVAGYFPIGTASRVPPERPRPDMAAKTEWICA